MDIVGRFSGLGKERIDEKAAGAALKDKIFFGFDGSWVRRAEGDGEVDDCAFLFMTEEGE